MPSQTKEIDLQSDHKPEKRSHIIENFMMEAK